MATSLKRLHWCLHSYGRPPDQTRASRSWWISVDGTGNECNKWKV